MAHLDIPCHPCDDALMDNLDPTAKQTTMNVSLPEALRAFVDDEVRARGYTSASEFVRELLREAKQRREQAALEADLLKTFASTGTAESAREAIEEIRRLRVGNRLGPDVTIRDLISEGRR